MKLTTWLLLLVSIYVYNPYTDPFLSKSLLPKLEILFIYYISLSWLCDHFVNIAMNIRAHWYRGDDLD